MRHPVLLQIVEQISPDFIGFQECQKPFLDYLLQVPTFTTNQKLPWVQKSYYISDATGVTINSYGCLLLSKIPPSHLIIQEFPTYMGRKLIAGEFLVNGKQIRVGTVHLESYPKDTEYRKRQLELSTKLLGAADMGILMGDCNFPDGEENGFLPSEFYDLWKVQYPKLDTEEAKGYTFDYKTVSNYLSFDIFSPE